MRITRKGLKDAAAFVTGAVAISVFVGAFGLGLPFFEALLVTGLCAVPSTLVETLFQVPEAWRWYRENRRSHTAMMGVMIALIAGWSLYQRSVDLDRAERVRTTLAASPLVPIVAISMMAFWQRIRLRARLIEARASTEVAATPLRG